MKFTASGEKATRVRGYGRVWLLDAGRRFEIIEVKPGVAIEDVDTRDVTYRGWDGYKYATLVEGSRGYKCEGASYSGWTVTCGNDYGDPISNKPAAIADALRELAGIKNWHWKD